MLLVEDTADNSKVSVEDIFIIMKEDLFPRSLIGTIMQDSGIRERKDDLGFCLIF